MKEKFILKVDSINNYVDKMSKGSNDNYQFYIDNFIIELTKLIDRKFFIKKNKFDKYNENKKKYLSNIFYDVNYTYPQKINPNIYESVNSKFKRNKLEIVLSILDTIEKGLIMKRYKIDNCKYNSDMYDSSLIYLNLNPKYKFLFDLSVIKHMYKMNTNTNKNTNAFKILRDQYIDYKNSKIIAKYKSKYHQY